MSYWYLATPYSKYRLGQEQAFIDAAVECGRLNKAGIITFSPIVHSHPLVIHGGMGGQTDFAAWQRYDEAMMRVSNGLIVCTLEGWEESTGVQAEIAWFRANRPNALRTAISPGEMPWWHRNTLIVSRGHL